MQCVLFVLSHLSVSQSHRQRVHFSMFNSSPCWFQPLLLDLESIFLSIPPSPSFLMNDSDDFRPEASGNLCGHHLSDELSLGSF